MKLKLEDNRIYIEIGTPGTNNYDAVDRTYLNNFINKLATPNFDTFGNLIGLNIYKEEPKK